MRRHSDFEGLFMPDLGFRKWQYFKKVYGVLLTKILTAIAVSSLMVFGNPYRTIVADLFLAGYFYLMSKIMNQNDYPQKFFFVGAETLIMSLLFGFVGLYVNNGILLLRAWVKTTAAVVLLSGYTFWASKRKMDIQFVKPIIFFVVFPFAISYMVYYGFTPGSGVRMVFSGTGAVFLCCIIVLETDEVIQSFFSNADKYIGVANDLFVLVFGLFMFIMGMLV